MCGIFGIIVRPPTRIAVDALRRSVRDLFLLSESRGKEAAGLAILLPDTIRVLKRPQPASEFIRTRAYERVFGDALRAAASASGELALPLAVIGHSRLVTTGDEELHENNQPVITRHSVGVHNGIICNHERIWQTHIAEPRQAEVDTEALLRLIELHMERGASMIAAARQAFSAVKGTASIAALSAARDAVLLATNNGSLYVICDEAAGAILFASERVILEQLLRKSALRGRLSASSIRHFQAGDGLLVRPSDLSSYPFSLRGEMNGASDAPSLERPRRIDDHRPQRPANGRTRVGGPGARAGDASRIEKLVDEGMRLVPELRRCTRCILPETMPFIEYDAGGVCNFCRWFEPIRPAGHAALLEAVAPYRRAGSGAECLLALSGGRDSTYALHYVCRELGMRPVTYTYDWGMVTDLARRNQARICGQLGIEHILVSADIRRKRENIRKNVSAWLRRPDLGTVPLFMAGDKQFFYHANRLGKQLGLDLLVFSMNPLERTDFKTGFCGIARGGSAGRFYGLGAWDRLRLGFYYARQFARNPAYLNSSLWDTLGAFGSYYFIPQRYLQFYHYVAWDEPTIERTLIDEYEWEVAPDTRSTWRIGDGTAAFYNYIYTVGAGFCENDTFRSNQIRQGLLDRDTALERVRVENRPRIESLRWYCDTIGVDCAEALRVINGMPKRYPA